MRTTGCSSIPHAGIETPNLSRCRLLVVAGLFAAMLASPALAQSVGALEQPAPQMPAPAKSVKPMTPERVAWLKGRCSQLVAFFDYWGVGRGENSDGPRNFTRISATIECGRTNYRKGIDSMGALLMRKAFEIPKPGTQALEPEDIEAPDINYR